MTSTYNIKSLSKRYAPFIVGASLIATFVRLGVWQLDRAAEKVALQSSFENPGIAVWVGADFTAIEYQPVLARGRYLSARQILIDNVVRNGQLGYFVISPYELDQSDELLLVNRGWIAKTGEVPASEIVIGGGISPISGKVGWLPGVALRPGEAFTDHENWPRIAVWPNYAEIAAEVGQPVLQFVLLLDPEQPHGFQRKWQPRDVDTAKHYGYAFQWFAMAICLLLLGGWNYRRQRSRSER